MLKASQFRLVSVQGVIFTPDLSAFSQPRLLGTVLGQYGDRYDGPAQALPLPDDVLSEVPRVILQSADGRWRLQAAPGRTESNWICAGEAHGRDAELVLDCVDVLVWYVRATQARVGRLGLVLTRVYETSDPPRLLIEHFCSEYSQKNAFRRSETFEIHNHKRYALLDDVVVNSWVRCKTARLTDTQHPVVLVEQDLNTLQDKLIHDRFDAERIRAYFERAAVEAEEILRVYFPEET